MGKRSDFVRVERDYYKTPYAAVPALLPHLTPNTRFCEPCAGDGTLIDHLTKHGHVCASAWDVEPQREDIAQHDARQRLIGNIDCFITNPPWARPLLHELIVHLSDQHPTWLLFDADWAHTRQAAPYLPRLKKIVSVGRLIWIPGTKMTGKDNCAWHLFERDWNRSALFFGRAV